MLRKIASSIAARRCSRDLVIESQDRDAEPSAESALCLANEVLAGALKLVEWNEAVEQWIERVNFLARAIPEQNLPTIGNPEREQVVLTACEGATSYRDIKDRPILPIVRALLTDAQQRLVERQAPDRFELPGGRRAKVSYAAGSDPVLSARIQDLSRGQRGAKNCFWATTSHDQRPRAELPSRTGYKKLTDVLDGVVSQAQAATPAPVSQA